MSAPPSQPMLFGSAARPAAAPASISLRPYQTQAIAEVYAHRRPGARVLCVAPTGAGKTVIGSQMILDELAAHGRVIFLAHRTELIAQTYAKLLAMGLDESLVGVIMADGVIPHPVTGRRVCCKRPLAPVQVASIDTLRRRPVPAGVTLVLIDECFPAGTMVDGRPIESIAVGDLVRSFNHATGAVEMRPVTHVFRSIPQAPLVTVRLADGTRITCTGGHPFYTRSGYVPAAALTHGVEVLRVEDQPEDVRGLQDDVYAAIVDGAHGPDLLSPVQAGAPRGAEARGGDVVRPLPLDGRAEGTHAVSGGRGRAGVLLNGVSQGRGVGARGADDGGYESPVGERAHDGEEPDALAGGAREGLSVAAHDGAQAESARWQRTPATGAAAENGRCARVADGDGGPDAQGTRQRMAGALQDRRGVEGAHDRRRGGRDESLLEGSAGAGRAQGRVPAWVRVDGVEVLERAGDGGPGPMCPDGHVYNLEVEGNHNYFVEGVLVHNCHRSLAKSYRDVVAACPQALTVGLTATPYRGDGRGLGDLFEHLVVVTTPRALMAEGFLAEPRVFSHPHRVDTSKVATVAGEFNQQQLAEAADKRELLGSIVEHWKRHLDGVRTVAFAVNVAHSRHIAQMFVEAGVPAEHLDGETPAEDRAATLARLDRGETLIVSNCGILTEGWDQPSVKGCILARPTKSRALYVQCAGRVLRPWRGETPVILDHAGSVLDHDLPHADWEITLDGKKKKAKQSVAIKECPACFAACPSNARTCFFCQHPFTDDTDSNAGDPLEERAGDLVEIRADALRALKLQTADARAELHEWTGRVDHAERLESGSTNRRAFKVFRKSRSEMSPGELASVRAWMLCEWPWLAPVAAPLRFAVPTIAEASPW